MIDGFADEGHRIGAYYLVRALNVTFYESMSHPVALKLAQEWLDLLNNPKVVPCDNVDIFDNNKTDPFEKLPDSYQRRSEVQFIKFFWSMFYALNAFTKPVDFLINKVLDMPMISEPKFQKCMALVVEQLDKHQSIDPLFFSDEFLGKLMEEAEVTDRRAAHQFLLRECFAQLTQSATSGARSSGGAPSAAPHIDPKRGLYGRCAAASRPHDVTEVTLRNGSSPSAVRCRVSIPRCNRSNVT